eukprot:11212299-Lingulodinium_polyedra.AAC.1
MLAVAAGLDKMATDSYHAPLEAMIEQTTQVQRFLSNEKVLIARRIMDKKLEADAVEGEVNGRGAQEHGMEPP